MYSRYWVVDNLKSFVALRTGGCYKHDKSYFNTQWLPPCQLSFMLTTEVTGMFLVLRKDKCTTADYQKTWCQT